MADFGLAVRFRPRAGIPLRAFDRRRTDLVGASGVRALWLQQSQNRSIAPDLNWEALRLEAFHRLGLAGSFQT